VNERPLDIRDGDVVDALARQWQLAVADLTYLPVGFGGYHWLAVDETGERWFVTVSDLAALWVPDLPAAMETAAWLAAEAGLEFVVAPVPTTAGEVVGPLDDRHALTLFQYLDGTPGQFDDPIDEDDRAAVIDLLARLHAVRADGFPVPSRPLGLVNRPAIDQALASLGVPWEGGPFAEPGRDLLARYQQSLRQALARFEDLVDAVRTAGSPSVITHGEPHPGNLLHTPAGLCLIDWDSAGLAHPERDLWSVLCSDQDAARYTARTGWTVDQDALALYRLRWCLEDTAEFLSEIRGPHERTADTVLSWTGLGETLEAIAEAMKTP
jgi:spectinomycin phosphotransferase